MPKVLLQFSGLSPVYYLFLERGNRKGGHGGRLRSSHWPFKYVRNRSSLTSLEMDLMFDFSLY